MINLGLVVEGDLGERYRISRWRIDYAAECQRVTHHRWTPECVFGWDGNGKSKIMMKNC